MRCQHDDCTNEIPTPAHAWKVRTAGRVYLVCSQLCASATLGTNTVGSIWDPVAAMTLAEACALAQEIQRDERAPWRVNKIEQWGPLTFWVYVSLLNAPSAAWWLRNRQEWEELRDSWKVSAS